MQKARLHGLNGKENVIWIDKDNYANDDEIIEYIISISKNIIK